MTDLTIRRAREIAYQARNEKTIRWPDVQVLVDAVLALTEQQPTINLLPAEPTEEQLRQFEAAMNDAIERGKVTVLTEQQSEPVSRDELTHQLRLRHASGFGQVAEELLSRYTITRKQPEGADHG